MTGPPGAGSVTVDLRPDRVLVVSVADTLGETDVRRYLDAMTHEVVTGRPFALLIRYAGGRPRKDAAGHRLETEWLRVHRPALRGVLVGVALVHHSGPLRRSVERIAMTGAGRRVFGCPCRPFAELDEAIAWSVGLVGAAS